MEAYLILENGKVFKGKAFGSIKKVTGELVFTTGMGGYIEALTDPSFYGEIVVQTFPIIGCYGVNLEDYESEKPHLKAYVVREYSKNPSNFRMHETLDDFLKRNAIPGIYDIDTREVTKIIRDAGVLNAAIVYDLNDSVPNLKNYKIIDAIKNVSSTEIVHHKTKAAKYRVLAYDFGIKKNIVKMLQNFGCDVFVVPYNIKLSDVIKMEPDGILLSSGPGDPRQNIEVINEVKSLIGKLPIFALCLGHQILALAKGLTTYKLKYGHRGENQPVKDLLTNRIYITSQNHGYCVGYEHIDNEKIRVRYINGNDNTIEGLDYLNDYAFSVQFHPEASPGPHDTKDIFLRFIGLMEEFRHAKK